MRNLLTILLIILSAPLLASNSSRQAGDSLLHLLDSTSSAGERIQIYRNLADFYLDDEAKAKTYLLKMYQEAAKIDDKKSMLDALHDIAIESANTNKPDTLIKYIHLIKKIATPEEVKYMLPLYHIRLFDAQCFSYQRNEAIEKELDMLDSQPDAHNIYHQLASTYKIGVSFYMNDKFKESIPYIEKALALAESLTCPFKYEYERHIIWKICFVYGQTGKEKKAIQLMEKQINLVEQQYETKYKARRPFYKIDLYRLQHYSFMICSLPYLTPEQENLYWNRVEEIGKNLTNPLDKYKYYLCRNNYYTYNRTKRDLPKAIAANDTLIKLAATLAPQNLPGLYEVHADAYELAKDYPNALKYLKISYHLQDSLATEKAQHQLNELQVKYDVNALNNEKANLEIKNKKIIIISLIVLLIIVAGVCSYLYFSLKREKRMKAELKLLNLKAQESEKMKQAFINSICHEIRTPLNAIVGFSDLVMNTEIDEETRREFPAEIQKNTLLLTSLVNNMLEVASLDVSEGKLPCEPADIRNICIQEMQRIVHKPEIEYRLDIPEETLFIPTNAQYLTLVIEHLLSNANKFTEKGHITLGYTVNDSQEKICISVTDTGCGIPEEKREEVFRRFSKLDTFVPGNGLGLYLCRLIVTRLDGEIFVATDYTEGTRMIVNLPIK